MHHRHLFLAALLIPANVLAVGPVSKKPFLVSPALPSDSGYRVRAIPRKNAWLIPQTAVDYLRSARTRLAQDDREGAFADIGKAIDLLPDYGEAYLLRGQLSWRIGEYVSAEADLRKAVQYMPGEYVPHAALGGLLTDLGRYDEGLAEVEQAVAIVPDDPGLLVERAQAHRRLNQFDAATADARAAISKNPSGIGAYMVLGDILVDQGLYEDALADAEAAALANPQDPLTHLLLGAAYAKLRRYPESRAELDKYAALRNTAQGYAGSASLRARTDIAGKRADIAAALKLDPGDPTALNEEAELDLRDGRYAAVIGSATRLIPEQFHNGPLIAYRGVAYSQGGNQALADKDFADARVAVGANSNGLNDLCWNKATLGVAFEAALEDCDAALRISPAAGYILDTRGLVLLRMGRFADAVETYDKALHVQPRLASSLYGRGLAKRHLGEADGDADIAAAKAIDVGIDKQFVDYGVTD